MASKRTEQQDRQNLVFSALTGRNHIDTSGKSTSVTTMLSTAYGTERRGKPVIDTRKAAKELGVSQRTVQRWIKEDNKPKPSNLGQLQKKSRQVASTKRGRQQSVAQSRKTAHFKKYGTHVSIRGEQGPAPSTAGKAYSRDRLTQLELDPAQYAGLVDAFETGGQAAAINYLTQLYDENYVADWQFQSILEMKFDDLSTRGGQDPRSL